MQFGILADVLGPNRYLIGDKLQRRRHLRRHADQLGARYAALAVRHPNLKALHDRLSVAAGDCAGVEAERHGVGGVAMLFRALVLAANSVIRFTDGQ